MKKLIVYDLDGTLIEGSSWVELNQSLGLTEAEDLQLFEEYKKGALSYASWIQEIMSIYHKYTPVHKEVIESLVHLLKFKRGTKELVQLAKEKGYVSILLSGSVDSITKQCADILGIEHVYATNELVFNNEGYLENIISMGDEAIAKVGLLEGICEKHGVETKDVICVGDGGNDIEIFKITKGILVGENSVLKEVAWEQVQSLEEVIELL